MRIFFAAVLLLLLRTGPAAADLYRWIDPETGSTKYSSYPPPWYGDEAQQRRAPKVEVIPARSDVVAKPETPGRRVEGSAPLKGAQPGGAQAGPDRPAKEEAR